MAPPAPLTARDLGRATLARQGLLEPITARAERAVARLVSLQAQHPEWPPVALAARAASRGAADLTGALHRREVVRSSLMRITIHVVAAADLWPMFAVVRPLRLAQWRVLLKADPHESALGRRIKAAHQVAIAALRERPHSSLELDRLLSSKVGEATSSVTRPAWRDPDARVVVRAAWRHFAAMVPLVHVPHDGEGYGRSRYALAADWLGMEEEPEIDEGAARIHVARRYLQGFGPASVDDLVAYVGRGKGGIGVWRDALAALGEETVTLRGDDGRTLVDLVDAPRPDPATPAPPRLLARWDSLLLSHGSKHRGRVIADQHRPAVFSRNADVLPTFLVDGMVAGTWELSRSDGQAAIRLQPFAAVRRDDREPLMAEAERVLGLIAPNADRSVELAPRGS
jgi:hypothetical protein